MIGLFQGILERNTLTFNPGWDDNAQALEDFTDVRELQRQLTDAGLASSSPRSMRRARGPGSSSSP